MNETTKLALPLLVAAQAQKEITHNQALVAIDSLLHLAVLSRASTAPPAAATAGDSFIVAAASSGDWAGKTGQIASHDGFGWSFTLPRNGFLAWIVDEQVFSVYQDGWSNRGWPVTGLMIAGRSVLGASPALVAAASGGSVVDVEARQLLNDLVSALRGQGLIA